MKKILGALVVALALSASPLQAKDINLHACTEDNFKVVLTIDFYEDAGKRVEEEIRVAFIKTAAGLTVEELQSGVGFRLFIENLSEENLEAIVGIEGLPLVDGGCAKDAH